MVADGRLAAVVAAFLAASMGAVVLYYAWEWVRAQRRRRDVLHQLRVLSGGAGSGPDTGAQSLFRTARTAESLLLQAVKERFPGVSGVDRVLLQAGLPWTLERYVTLTAVWGLAGGVVAMLVVGGGTAVLAGAVAGALLPSLHVRRRRARRLRAFEEQIPEGIDLIARAIRAGHPLASGLRMVAEEAAEPLAGEFRRVFEEQKFGLPFEESLNGLMVRMPLVDVRILVTAILVQRDVGGNLAEILDNLSRMIRTRFTIRRQLQAFTAQGRMSGYVLAALPVVVGALIFLMNPQYVMVLFRETAGKYMLCGAVGLQLLGFLCIRKIVAIPI